jgi:hypothetical protein
MKKLFTISVAMSALFFVSMSANAQNSSSRNMERRDQYDQNDQYDRNNNNDQYSRGNDNNQYSRGGERANSRRPQVTVVFSTNGRRGNDGYNDRRYNDNDRRYDNRRCNDYGRYDRYERNRGCQSNQRGWH